MKQTVIGYPGYYCKVCDCWMPLDKASHGEIISCPECGTQYTTAELEMEKEESEDK